MPLFSERGETIVEPLTLFLCHGIAPREAINRECGIWKEKQLMDRTVMLHLTGRSRGPNVEYKADSQSDYFEEAS
jgi:hypothetical protein